MKKKYYKLVYVLTVIKWVIRLFYFKEKPAVRSLDLAAQISVSYTFLESITKLCSDNCYELWQKMPEWDPHHRSTKMICQKMIEAGFVGKFTYQENISAILKLIQDGNNKSTESSKSNR